MEGNLKHDQTLSQPNLFNSELKISQIKQKKNVLNSSVWKYCSSLTKTSNVENQRRQKIKEMDSSTKEIMDVVYQINKMSFSTVMSPVESEIAESDVESIYEDSNTITKTIFRSTSFDEDSSELIFDENPQNDSKTWNYNRYSGFKNTTKTFPVEQDRLLMENKIQSKKLIPGKIKKEVSELSDFGNENKTNEEQNVPSINSNDSISFDDLVVGDILDSPGTEREDQSIICSVETSSSNNLTFREEKIVDAIVTKLRKQLQPTLKFFEKNAGKYEAIKSLYRLPSISILNESTRHELLKKGQKFNVKFNDGLIHELVHDETAKQIKREIIIQPCPVITAEEQLKLNFNKFRKLDTIIEETKIYTSQTEETEYQCGPNSQSLYQRATDTRSVEELEDQELLKLFKLLRRRELSDLNKVERMVSLFEHKNYRTINKMNNKQLEDAILRELSKRKFVDLNYIFAI